MQDCPGQSGTYGMYDNVWNYQTDFNNITEMILGWCTLEYIKDLNSMENSSCHGNQKKKNFKKPSGPKP